MHDLKCAIEMMVRISFELRNSNYESQCNFAYTWSKILSLEWSLKLRNSNYASQCNFAYTRSKILSFEWSFKLRNSNDNSNCTLFLSCENRQWLACKNSPSVIQRMRLVTSTLKTQHTIAETFLRRWKLARVLWLP